jgi:AraC-like DNA-binding protein
MKFYSSLDTPALPNANHLYTLSTETFSVDVDPINQHAYRAMAEVAVMGSLAIAKIETNGAVVTRKGESSLDKNGKRYSLVIAVQGDLMISHHLGMSELKSGDFVLMDNAYPRTMFVYNEVSLLIVTIPLPILQRFIPLPEDVEGQKLTAVQAGEARQTPFYEPFITLWDSIKKGQLKEFATVLSDNFLGSLASLYSQCCRQESGRAAKRIIQTKQLIEEQLGNPELTVELLAQILGVSSRYLRALFSRSEKISHYILRRRLEECANQLANVLHQNISITSIAFQCGFNSTAHFSRAFRKQYGVSAREYRRQHQARSAPAL